MLVDVPTALPMGRTVPLVEYLFTRLYQLGIRGIHGVPGDYNLVSLDYVEKTGLNWIGDANELNAGYAADGYARVKGIGAFMTVFGVGELSAINAVAGSYAEYVPVVHIVGTPSTPAQQRGMVLHHTLGDGDYHVFADMYKRVTVAQSNLDNVQTAPAEIDRVLRECWLKSRPVYFQLPTDMVTQDVGASALGRPIDLSYPSNDPEVEEYVTKEIMTAIESAKQPVILVDGCIARHRLIPEVLALIHASKLPTFVSPMGKGCVDETISSFIGVYAGAGSVQSMKRFFENSDLVLSLGAIKSDINTTGFTYRNSQLKTIEFHSDFILKGYARFDLHMRGVISRLASKLDSSNLSIIPFTGSKIRQFPDHLRTTYAEGVITHDYLWNKLSSWLKPNDILLTETGTAYLGVWDTVFPSYVTLISQILWSSIGYALPAAQGAAVAASEIDKTRRVILFEGDGSFQLTAQSISTMLRNELNITIFLLNNQGYTIERWIHGMEARYNDIPTWKYSHVPEVFGATSKSARAWIIETREELEVLWESKEFAAEGMKFVEMRMPKEDAPVILKMVCESAAKANVGQSKVEEMEHYTTAL
ncbi:Pyruvate decarboxylase 1 [Lambiella insularis]|nr:Pyruvate decarboxylase 1 [Lambiella insularis]